MSAPEVVTHSDLEVAERDNEGKMSNWSKSTATADYQHLPQPVDSPRPDYNNYAEGASPQKRKGLCGIPAKAFCLGLAIMIAMLGVGLGAGVGAGMSIQRNKATSTTAVTTVTVTASPTSSPTSTATSTTYTPSTLVDAVLPQNGTLLLNCPSIDASTIRITLGSTLSRFTVSCGTDTNAANQDILALISYGIEDCAQACASYNHNYGQAKCVAATFQRNLTDSVVKDYGNCWLKNGTAGTSTSARNDFAGLRLVV